MPAKDISMTGAAAHHCASSVDSVADGAHDHSCCACVQACMHMLNLLALVTTTGLRFEGLGLWQTENGVSNLFACLSMACTKVSYYAVSHASATASQASEEDGATVRHPHL